MQSIKSMYIDARRKVPVHKSNASRIGKQKRPKLSRRDGANRNLLQSCPSRLHSPPGCLLRLPNTFCVIFAPTAELPIAPAFAAGLPIAPAEHVCVIFAPTDAPGACIRRRAAYRACHYTAASARCANRNLLFKRKQRVQNTRLRCCVFKLPASAVC